jgi:hypothetical protein
MRAKGIKAPFLAVDALANDDFGGILRPREIDPRLALEDPESGDPKPNKGEGELGEVRVLASPDAFGPQATGARTAAAIGLWQAASTANAADPGAALATIVYDDAALGQITFDAKGDAGIPSYLVCAWRDGAWRPVAASEADNNPPP